MFKFLVKKSLILLICFVLFSCGENRKENVLTTDESEMVNSDQPESIIKDSITYYNGNQKVIEINKGDYFGFAFEANAQNLDWKFVSNLVSNLSYISESYEPFLDVNQDLNGVQYYTFKALEKGNSKIEFHHNYSNEKKIIKIKIK